MRAKEIIKSQYRASLEMLRQAIAGCPDPLWGSAAYKNQTWHIAYHVLFYTHLYLHSREEDFVPWEKHNDRIVSLGDSPQGLEGVRIYSKEEILAYLDLCLDQVEIHVEAMELEGASGFHWLPFSKLELQFYNIRHVQQHTGELSERLGAHGDFEVDWVGMKPAV